MASFSKKTVIRTIAIAFLAVFLVVPVGCNSSSSGKGKSPFTWFPSKSPKPVEKTGPRTMDEVMSMPRDNDW